MEQKLKILCISKLEFNKTMEHNVINDDNVEQKDKVCLISITDPDEGDKTYDHYFKNNHKNVINQKFGDVEKDIKTTFGLCNAMSIEQAQELYEFIKRNKNIKSWIIHCTAGISRSGAVATFINDYLEGDKTEFKKNNPFISPNPHVYRLLYEQYKKDIYGQNNS